MNRTLFSNLELSMREAMDIELRKRKPSRFFYITVKHHVKGDLIPIDADTYRVKSVKRTANKCYRCELEHFQA